MNYPKVSIVIPVYNGSNYLREAIDSALAQTYKNIEIIVVNDGSTDEGATEEIAKSYGDRIRYLPKTNGGVATALNMGIKEMTGEYFSWLSHDDIYLPEKIETQVAALSARKNKETIVYSDFEFIDENGQFVKTKRIQKIKPEELRFRLMDRAPVVHGCAALIPKSCFAEVGLFEPGYRVVQDVDMLLKLSREFEFVHIPKVLIQSRIHTHQGTENLSPDHLEENRIFLNRYFDEIADNAKKDAVRFLLMAATTLIRSPFPASANYAYRLAINKIKRNPALALNQLPRLFILWISQQHFWRFLRIFTAVPYRHCKMLLARHQRNTSSHE